MNYHIVIAPLPNAKGPRHCQIYIHLHGHRRVQDLLLALQPDIMTLPDGIGFYLDAPMIEYVAAALHLTAEPEVRPDYTLFDIDLEVLCLTGDAHHDRATLQPLYYEIVQDLRDAVDMNDKLICFMIPSNLPEPRTIPESSFPGPSSIRRCPSPEMVEIMTRGY